ncbi:two-component system, OmpR family, osmolarity sensor histidine kinase EnvZ [Cupriavidus metallidurans]|jgi:two-component system osmolarity sensor histidine kinase EnvZ|uniref:histidine kinase n=1 Tax=Cupriavidus metallidurans (strain ATCC 43123 / DSM 2839 / NBRC 102507 / CH34) TaxID=266264 RepID=Q1LR24_CUPMC|nr:ATP-binding protein [Cupriavidus metallidurans]ABF07402.1 sensor histidine kinase in two-component regulatory system up with Au [Cupriavidus metallidurans CH34]AVA32651.1 HAMP domain-containing protein [Cupriavidus metallidurans]MDE4916813.1 ATP-binding protein [Cupriavidus metallidurans]QGS28266.1 HAMP domain-containing protein [Cupriavidus metallidurans]UBM11512.1 HAMP domain-containing protein [Cupriavidus metallidurans]
MKLRIDTLFGRIALLIAAVLVISHFSWLAILRMDRRQQQIDYSVEQMIFQLDSIQRALDATPPLPLPSLVEVADASTADEHASVPQAGRARRLVEQFTRRLPPGTEVRLEDELSTPRLWIKLPKRNRWIAMPILFVHNPPPDNRLLPGVVLVVGIAIIFALLIAWQIQRPVRDMAEAAEKLSRQQLVSPLRERGPHELRQLIERFNRMVADLVRIDQERNTMLAGIAHDLKTPLARLRLRAEMLSDPKAAAGVTRDVESMSAIVEQFLTFAQSSEPTARPVPVDKRIGELAASLQEQDRKVVLELNAGDGFRMIATQLDRIIGNLVDNAYAYGEPPVCVATSRTQEGWKLIVEDEGPGIPDDAIERVTMPFVRLDPARGGNAHSGLGLAIVDRLVRQAGGRLSIANREEGGLRVEMVFPFAAMAQAA